MKSGLPHTVPLSSQAIDILIDAKTAPAPTMASFSLRKPPQNTFTPDELCDLLHSVGERAVPHGMRASFRNWSGRTPEISKEVAEAAMAHSQDRVVAAYLTDDFVEERIDVMQLWGDFLTDPMEPVINATPSEKGGTRPKIKSKDEPATIP